MPGAAVQPSQAFLLKAIQSNNKKIAKLLATNAQYRREYVAQGCPHTELQDYHWEWDSGYGSQTRHIGKRCSMCSFIDPYNNGKFHKEEF